jgi:hypothetical protein
MHLVEFSDKMRGTTIAYDQCLRSKSYTVSTKYISLDLLSIFCRSLAVLDWSTMQEPRYLQRNHKPELEFSTNLRVHKHFLRAATFDTL